MSLMEVNHAAWRRANARPAIEPDHESDRFAELNLGDCIVMTPIRAIWFSIGVIALALAGLGVALPLLPTTPFLLLAAFAFARSSDRWHDWLLNHKVFGPLIDDWRRHRAIDRRVKIVSIISMAAVFGLSLAINASTAVLVVQAVVLSIAAVFILSRASPPRR